MLFDVRQLIDRLQSQTTRVNQSRDAQDDWEPGASPRQFDCTAKRQENVDRDQNNIVENVLGNEDVSSTGP